MSSSSAPAPMEQPISEALLLVLGPVFIGTLFSWLLYGVSCVQLYLYHVSTYNDATWIRSLVYVIFLLDTYHSIVAAFMGWNFLCSGWGRPSALVYPGWTFVSIPIISGIVAALVQVFYAWRIHILRGWRVLPMLIIALALLQAGGGISTGIGVIPFTNVSQIHALESRIDVWLAGSATVDVIISVSMVYILFTARRSSMISLHGERVINRLIRLSVETGIATTTTAVLELGMFFWTPNANFYVLLSLILCKVYSNALMTSLNSRALLKRSRTGQETTTASTYSGSASATFGGTRRYVDAISLPPISMPVVHVSSETEVFRNSAEKPPGSLTANSEYDSVEMVENVEHTMPYLESAAPMAV
ncbi:hypothetical protein PENSPDRAFT_98416 [Peniophora sp. CONT]|nr:hypothetical protein PENSPDRAFT_98416 [Peniophora sp. CONT]